MSADGHDQWHRHTQDEGVPQTEHGAHASAKALGLTFIGMTLGVLLVIIILKVYFDSYMSSYKAKIDENTEAAKVSWTHKQEVLASMASPVRAATDMVIADYARNN